MLDDQDRPVRRQRQHRFRQRDPAARGALDLLFADAGRQPQQGVVELRRGGQGIIGFVGPFGDAVGTGIDQAAGLQHDQLAGLDLAVGQQFIVEAATQQVGLALVLGGLEHVPVGQHRVGADQEAGADGVSFQLDAADPALDLAQARLPDADVELGEVGPHVALQSRRMRVGRRVGLRRARGLRGKLDFLLGDRDRVGKGFYDFGPDVRPSGPVGVDIAKEFRGAADVFERNQQVADRGPQRLSRCDIFDEQPVAGRGVDETFKIVEAQGAGEQRGQPLDILSAQLAHDASLSSRPRSNGGPLTAVYEWLGLSARTGAARGQTRAGPRR